MISSPKPINPKNSFTWYPYISRHGIGLEKMPKDQRKRFWKIIVLNLMTFFLDYTLILWGEIWYLSPLGLDVLNNTRLYTVSPCSTLQTPKEVLWMDQLSSHSLCFLLLQCLLRKKKRRNTQQQSCGQKADFFFRNWGAATLIVYENQNPNKLLILGQICICCAVFKCTYHPTMWHTTFSPSIHNFS